MKASPSSSARKWLWLACMVALTSNAQNLKIYHIDVDQASATLFITPSGTTLLVDAGKNGAGATIKKILQQEGITRIDHFVNTHYHEDHFGGIDDLVNDTTITVVTAYDRGDKGSLPATKRNEPTYKDYHAAVGHRAIPLAGGMQIPVPGLVVTCISRGGIVLGETGTDTGQHENDMSVSLLIRFGNFKYFVGGDIEVHTEDKIAARDLVMDVDVYVADHHGSHTSSSPNFMQDLVPSVVVISNGSNESYFHPRLVTLNTYSQLSPPPVVFQTNKYMGSKPQAGNVADEFIADLNAVGDEGTILIEVAQAQGNYTVQYRNQTKTFPMKHAGTVVGMLPNQVVIESVRPDPVGADASEESVTIKNKSATAVTLTGWVLRDASSRVWPLDSFGQLTAGQSRTIKRNGMPMTLNNDGDIVMLVNADNAVVDQFQYVGSVEGQAISTGH